MNRTDTFSERRAIILNKQDCRVSNYSAAADYIIGRTRLVTISTPEAPAFPSDSMIWKSNVLAGILLGLFLGFDWIVLYAVMCRAIRTKEDLREKLNQPCLGVIPQVQFKKYRQKIDTRRRLTMGKLCLSSVCRSHFTIRSCSTA